MIPITFFHQMQQRTAIPRALKTIPCKTETSIPSHWSWTDVSDRISGTSSCGYVVSGFECLAGAVWSLRAEQSLVGASEVPSGWSGLCREVGVEVDSGCGTFLVEGRKVWTRDGVGGWCFHWLMIYCGF